MSQKLIVCVSYLKQQKTENGLWTGKIGRLWLSEKEQQREGSSVNALLAHLNIWGSWGAVKISLCKEPGHMDLDH
jgi:hypothetical protein